MQKKKKITDIHSLREARIELEAEVLNKEIEIISRYQELKSSLFDFSTIKSMTASVLKGVFLDKKIGFLTTAIGSLILSKTVRSNNKWVDRISTATLGIFSSKWGKLVKDKISSIFK